MALTNTIEVTKLNFNTGTTKFFITNIIIDALNAGSRIYWGPAPPTPGGGEATVTYKTIKQEAKIFIETIVGTAISGYSGSIYSDPSRSTQIGVGFGTIQTNTGSTRRYTGFDYLIHDATGNIVINSSTTNLILYPEDDNGGPQIVITDPGFVPMGEPIAIKSALSTNNASTARVRYCGVVSETDPTDIDQNTITTINGQTSNTFYPSNGGLWIGIDVEPTLNNEDYLYAFFADSNCYHSQTILETENGSMCIKDIERGMLVKTRNGFKKVVRVLSNGCKLKDFCCIRKKFFRRKYSKSGI